MINVLIVDDNKSFCLALVNYVLKYSPTLRIADIATNGKQAIKSINELHPDILLLDIKLPYISGIDIMKYVQKQHNYSPKIIFISGDVAGIKELNHSCGEYMLIEKSTAFSNILTILSNIANNIEDSKKILKIQNMLNELGFNRTNIGYKYLTDSIFLAYLHPHLLINLEKNIYHELSKKYNVSLANIKWNIQKAINSMWRYSNEKFVLEELNIKNKIKPTAKLIISVLISKL